MSHKRSMLEEAKLRADGILVDTTQFLSIQSSSSNVIYAERSQPSSKPIEQPQLIPKISLAYELKPHKTKCGMCHMYFHKDTMEYKVPQHRIIDLQKASNYDGMVGRRYQCSSFLYTLTRVCTMCTQYFMVVEQDTSGLLAQLPLWSNPGAGDEPVRYADTHQSIYPDSERTTLYGSSYLNSDKSMSERTSSGRHGSEGSVYYPDNSYSERNSERTDYLEPDESTMAATAFNSSLGGGLMSGAMATANITSSSSSSGGGGGGGGLSASKGDGVTAPLRGDKDKDRKNVRIDIKSYTGIGVSVGMGKWAYPIITFSDTAY